MTMTPRERVKTALNHREPDRVPMDLTITLGAYTKLVKYLGMEREVDPEPKVANWLTYVPIDLKILRALNIDIVHLGSRPPSGFPKELPDGGYIDEWGIKRVPISRPAGGFYYEFDGNPLANATIKDLDDYPWPDPHDPAVTDGLVERIKWWHDNTNLAIEVWLERGGLGEQAGYLRGIEKWWEDLVINQDFAVALMDKLCDLAIEFNRVCLELIGKYINVVRFTGWDLGGQQGLIFSPAMCRRLFKPLWMRQWWSVQGFLKRVNPEAKVFFHTCGGVYPLMGDFIESGLDVLDPLQTTAKGMDMEQIKREFGDKLSFHGAMDIQQLMPFASVPEVYEEVKLRIKQLAPGGGFVLAPAHAFQDDTPPENIVAMYEAGLKYGHYPINL
jgi:uroporphyrinogen decarboxylase